MAAHGDRGNDVWPDRLPHDIEQDLTALVNKIATDGSVTAAAYSSLRTRVTTFLCEWRSGQVDQEGISRNIYYSFDDFLLSFIGFPHRKQLEDLLFSLPGDGNTKTSRRTIAERRKLCDIWSVTPVELARLFPGQMQSRRFLREVYRLAKATDKDTAIDFLERARLERRDKDRVLRRRGVKKDTEWTPSDALRAIEMLEDQLNVVIRRRKAFRSSPTTRDSSPSSHSGGPPNDHEEGPPSLADHHSVSPESPSRSELASQHTASSPENGRNHGRASVCLDNPMDFGPPEDSVISTNSQKHSLSNNSSPARHLKKSRATQVNDKHIPWDLDTSSASFHDPSWCDAPSGLSGSLREDSGTSAPGTLFWYSAVDNAPRSPPVFGGGPPYAKPREYLNVDPESVPELLNFGGWIRDNVIHSALRLLNLCRPSDLACVSPWATASNSSQTRIPGLAQNNLKIVLLPLHIKSSHWVLAVAHPHDRRIDVFDSLPRLDEGGHAARDTLNTFIRSHGEQIAAWATWEIRMGCCPIQPNNVDCGVFLIALAYHVAINEPFPQQLDGRAWRYMLVCLLGKTLDIGIPDVIQCIKPPPVQSEELQVPALQTAMPNAVTDPKGFTKFLEQFKSFQDKLAAANNKVKVTSIENSKTVSKFCDDGSSLASNLKRVIKIMQRLGEMAQNALDQYRNLSGVAGEVGSFLRARLETLRGFGLPLGAVEQDVINLVGSSEAIENGTHKDILSIVLLGDTRNLIEAAVEDLQRGTVAFEGELHKRREEANQWPTVLS